MAQPARQFYDFEDYLRLEAMSPIKHEWLDGTVWAMAGGTPAHAAISVNVTTQLSLQLRGRPCRVFGSDLRVRVKPGGLATYPDASVVCGKLQFDSADKSKTTIANAKVIVEVLRPSTEKYDLGEKLEHYKRMASLEEIVFVHHRERRIDVWRRERGGWRATPVTEGVAPLDSIECELSIAEVFRDPLES
jgi:Uma2 family endonuclease